ncbi:hypothetical protein AFLA70_213g001551 [Aspergillus flavus AF70]|nr:hypothetical protein AFLA70_213g001551 [Aspergillus flavus AF70]
MPNAHSPRSQKPPHPKPSYDSLPSTLPLPKHHLPARPPAEVCVHVSANTQPCTPSSSQTQTRETSVPGPESNTVSEEPKYGATSPRDLMPHIPAPGPIPRCGPRDNTSISTEPPAFQGDYAEYTLSSPSISSSDDSLEEFLRLPDAQDNIPIDPVILANHGSWEETDLQSSTSWVESLISPEAACQYPDPPAILHGPPPSHYRDPSERDGGENGGTQTSDHLPTYDCQQVHPSSPDPGPGPSYPSSAQGNDHVRGQRKSAKRKTPQSDGRGRKRHRVHSPSPSREDAFTALRSHFVSLPLNDRLQFPLGYLKKSVKTEMQGTNCSSPPHGTEQSPGVSREARGSSRKGKAWSTKEKDFLGKLKKVDSRPWPETIRLFLEQYPGRTPGAIQVFWYTTLNKKAD